MKTIYLIRHAKTKAEDPSGEDFLRKLTDQGKQDAKNIAEKLVGKNTEIELFISSPATRAIKTCKIFSEIMQIHKNDIIIKDELYLAPASEYLHVIHQLPNDINSVAIFAHNPGITDFVNSLSNIQIDNMPTTSVFAMEFNVHSWRAIESTANSFLFFERP